jgi:hypothetical protein
LNIGARKVGAAMKRLPQLYYGDKAKEQTFQRWDPISSRVVNIRPPLIITEFKVTINAEQILAEWYSNRLGYSGVITIYADGIAVTSLEIDEIVYGKNTFVVPLEPTSNIEYYGILKIDGSCYIK